MPAVPVDGPDGRPSVTTAYGTTPCLTHIPCTTTPCTTTPFEEMA